MLLVSGSADATADNGPATWVGIVKLVLAPVVIYFALGRRSQQLLDELEAWMIAHNPAIMAAILLVLGAKLLGDGLAAL